MVRGLEIGVSWYVSANVSLISGALWGKVGRREQMHRKPLREENKYMGNHYGRVRLSPFATLSLTSNNSK